MRELAVHFPCGNLQLEGVLSMPEGDGPFPGVVVCHPHPLHGGSMDNNVVQALASALRQKSIASLRFNFRGVAGSQGKFSDGMGEQEDASAALAWLAGRGEVDKGRLGLAGYSFGASVAIPVALKPSVKALALVSPPLRGEAPDLLQRNRKPKLIVAGGRDSLIPISDVERLVAALPPPRELLVVPEADHFWWGHEAEIAGRTAAFFLTALAPG